MIYATRAIGLRYIMLDVQKEQNKNSGVSPPSIVSELVRFICYDWIFLIYIFVWIVSLIFDIAVIVVGAMDIKCTGGVALMISGIYHLIFRSTLIWFFCCICCNVSMSE